MNGLVVVHRSVVHLPRRYLWIWEQQERALLTQTLLTNSPYQG